MTYPRKPDVATASGPRGTGFAIETGTAAWMELWSRLSSEAAHFAADRLCETAKTQQQMMQARTLAEVAALRVHWWQKAAEQYAAETGRFTEIWREALDRMVSLQTGPHPPRG